MTQFHRKKPCDNCPFSKGMGSRFMLGEERLMEIALASSFQCHKSIDYGNFEDDIKRQGEHPVQCAGIMATLHRDGTPNQIMQLGQRLGYLDPDALDPEGTAYDSMAQAIKAHVDGMEP